MAVGMLPLAIYLPLIQSARTYSGTFWARPYIGSIAEFYGYLLIPLLLPALGVGFCAAGWYFLRRVESPAALKPPQSGAWTSCAGVDACPTVERWLSSPLVEVVAGLVFLLLPAVAVAIAVFGTGAYTHRYAIPAVIGCSVLAVRAMSRLSCVVPGVALIAAVVLSLFFIAKQVRTMPWAAVTANHQALIPLLERHMAAEYELLIADPHLFFELSHQAPSLRSRVAYVAEPQLALQHIGTDAVDRSLLGISAYAPLQMKTLQEVAASRQPFLIYGYPAPNGWAWIVQHLASVNVPMSVVGNVNGRLLLLVNDPAAASASATGVAIPSSPVEDRLRGAQ
jgi:hypothetical protein